MGDIQTSDTDVNIYLVTVSYIFGILNSQYLQFCIHRLRTLSSCLAHKHMKQWMKHTVTLPLVEMSTRYHITPLRCGLRFQFVHTVCGCAVTYIKPENSINSTVIGSESLNCLLHLHPPTTHFCKTKFNSFHLTSLPVFQVGLPFSKNFCPPSPNSYAFLVSSHANIMPTPS